MIKLYQNGEPVPCRMIRSIQRWVHHHVPYWMTGNKLSKELTSKYLLLLALFKLVWPHSTYYECIAFIANEASIVRIFNEKNISRALCGLSYTSKVALTVAYQVFTQRNYLWRQIFWTRPWPAGIFGMPRKRVIDIDEFGLHLNSANKKYKSSPKGLKICKPGNYDRGTFKLTVILAVEPGDAAVPNGPCNKL